MNRVPLHLALPFEFALTRRDSIARCLLVAWQFYQLEGGAL